MTRPRWLLRLLRQPVSARVDEPPPETIGNRPLFIAEQLRTAGPHQVWALDRLHMDNLSVALPHALPYLGHEERGLRDLAFDRLERFILPRAARTWLVQLPGLVALSKRHRSSRLKSLRKSVEDMLQVCWSAGMLAEGERSKDREVRRHAWRLGLSRSPLDPELAEAAFQEEVIVRAELLEVVQDDDDWLRRFLVDPSKRLRHQAFDRLLDRKPTGWLDDVRRMLLDGDREVRQTAGYVLRQHGEDPAEAVSRSMTDDPRPQALRALGETGNPEHLRLIEPHLDSPDRGVREAAFQATVRLDEEGSSAELERILRAPNGELKRKALSILGERGYQLLGTERLLVLAGDDDPDTRGGVRRIARSLPPAVGLAVLLRSWPPSTEIERRELRALVEGGFLSGLQQGWPLVTPEDREIAEIELEAAEGLLPADLMDRLRRLLAACPR